MNKQRNWKLDGCFLVLGILFGIIVLSATYAVTVYGRPQYRAREDCESWYVLAKSNPGQVGQYYATLYLACRSHNDWVLYGK